MEPTIILAATDFREVLQSSVLYIGLPILAIMAMFAVKAGKAGALLGIMGAGLLALAFTFGDVGVWQGIGGAVADGINAALQWTV